MVDLVRLKKKDIKPINIIVTIDNQLTYKCNYIKTTSRITYNIYCEQTEVRRNIIVQNYPKADIYNLTPYKNLLQEVINSASMDAKILDMNIDIYNYEHKIV